MAASCAASLASSAALAGRNVVAAKARTSKAKGRAARGAVVVRADGAATQAPTAAEIYEVTLEKPIGVKFARGNDGGAYCVAVPPEPQYDDFEIGDKILKVSASFGNDIWDADSYGQVIYAIKNRNGDIYLQMQKMNGDLSALEQSEKSTGFKNERAGGNYGSGTKEQQLNNYSKKKELEVQRLDMFDEGIALYNKEDFDNALIVFEEVAALEPKNFMSDNFETSTEIYKVAQYNIACCFSKLGQIDNSISALKRCMGAGWKDFKKIRTDPSLDNVHKSPKFTEMIDKFDEPLFNQNAINIVKGIFGGKK